MSVVRDKSICVIQARMNSSRLPGKILYDLKGHCSLWRVWKSAVNSSVNFTIVATTTNPLDDITESFCLANNILIYRGDEDDVLERYYEVVKKSNARTVVRLTADCPMITSKIIDDCISVYYNSNTEYAYSHHDDEGKKGDGFDVEVFSFSALEDAFKNSKEREHVTAYIRKMYNGVKACCPENGRSLNTIEDYKWLCRRL